MKNFNVFNHPEKGYVAVKDGFAWWGFWFPFPWALVSKMWQVATLLFVVVFSFSFVSALANIGDIVPFIFSILVSIFIGIKGNEYRCSNLTSKGYKFLGKTFSQNKESAIADVLK